MNPTDTHGLEDLIAQYGAQQGARNTTRTYRQEKRMKNNARAMRDVKEEGLMCDDSLAHTNLYAQRRQETFVQHEFH